MKLKNLLQDPTFQVLELLGQKDETRFIEVQRNARLSRSTINAVIRDLQENKLISRRIGAGKPIEVYYSLTAKGRDALASFRKLKSL